MADNEQSSKQPWNRPKKETAKAMLFCDAYLAMGPERSLKKLSKMEIDGMQVALRYLAEWSTLWGWQERARAYDAEQLEKKRQARQEAIDDMNLRHITLGLDQQANAVAQISALIAKGDFKDSATVQLLKLAVDLERLGRGAALDRVNVELTGKDGGKIETDVVVETFWGRGTDPRRKNEDTNEEATEGDEEAEDDSDFSAEVEEEEDDSFTDGNS